MASLLPKLIQNHPAPTEPLEAGALRIALDLHQRAPALSEAALIQAALEQTVRLTGSAVGYVRFVAADQAGRQPQYWFPAGAQPEMLERAGAWVDALRLKRAVVQRRHLVAPALDEAGQVRLVLGVGQPAQDYADAAAGPVGVVAETLGRIMADRQAAELARRLGRLQTAVSQINEAVMRVTDLEQFFGEACRLLVEAAGFELAWVVLRETPAGPLKLAGRQTAAGAPRALRHALYQQGAAFDINHAVERALAQGQPGLLNQLALDTDPAAHAAAAFPLGPAGQVIGALGLYAAAPGYFGAEVAGLLERLAANLAFAVALAQREAGHHTAENSLRRLDELEMLQQIAHAMTSTLDLDRVLVRITDAVESAMNVEAASVLLVDEASGDLIIHVASGDGAAAARQVRVPRGQGVAGWVIQTGQTALVPDVSADQRFYRGADNTTGFLTRSILAVPLVRQDRVLGVLEAMNKRKGLFGESDAHLLEVLGTWATVALVNARLFAQVADGKREWETTFDSLAEGVALYDADLTLRRVNLAFSTMVGLMPTTLAGSGLEVALAETPGVEPLLAAMRAREKAEVEVVEARSHRRLQLALYPLPERGGGVLVARDVTAERQWQARLAQSEKLASLGQLSAGVAHEINNPLGYVRSNLDTLARYARDFGALVPAYRQALAAAGQDAAKVEAGRPVDYLLEDMGQAVTESLEGVERVQGIVVSLKSFARADAGADLKPTNIQWVLESALKLTWNELKYKAEVVRDYTEVPLVRGRAAQLNQVFVNLLVNAGQAIAGHGQITVRTRAVEGWVTAAVEDTGSGIPPDVLPHIFDPFFTTKEVGQGTGLGLSVVYGIAEAHGGRIEVVSQPGQGTTFTLWLPIPGEPQ